MDEAPKPENIPRIKTIYTSVLNGEGNIGMADEMRVDEKGNWQFKKKLNIPEFVDEPVAVSEIAYTESEGEQGNSSLLVTFTDSRTERFDVLPKVVGAGELEGVKFGELKLGTKIHEGGMGIVYLSEYKGEKGSVVKVPRNDDLIHHFNAELDFIESHQSYQANVSFRELGIPIDEWKVESKFVLPYRDANNEDTRKKGWLVLPVVAPIMGADTLKTFTQDDGEKFDKVNLKIPLSLHLANVMTWVKTLDDLKKEGLTMDSNIWSDKIMDGLDADTCTVGSTRLDCLPQDYDDELSAHNMKSTLQEIQNLWKDMQRYPLYSGHSMLNIDFDDVMEDIVSTGRIKEPDQLFDRLVSKLKEIDWSEGVLADEAQRVIEFAKSQGVEKLGGANSTQELKTSKISSAKELVLSVLDRVGKEDEGKVFEYLNQTVLSKDWSDVSSKDIVS